MHRDNVDWILDNGIHSGNSDVRSSQWVSIGNQELINKRANLLVPRLPGGVLNDYVPFYFTPFSVMLANIQSGRSGIVRRSNSEIVIFVSSLRKVAEFGLPYLFTDKHAYFHWTSFYGDLADLDKVDWDLLQRRDFKRDPEDPEKLARYQAEALVYKHVPISALLGVVCSTDGVREQIAKKIEQKGLNLEVHMRPAWYF